MIEGEGFAGVSVWAMFTGCGKRGKQLGCWRGMQNSVEMLWGRFNTEFAEVAEKREEKCGMIGWGAKDGCADDATSM
jgi:hypothetical protein